MIDGRKKGIVFEQRFAEFLRIHGYQALTSRAESKNMDDKGVDIIDNTPFYFQCKAVEQSMNMHKILERMPTEKIRVVVHKRNKLKTTVTLYLEDFANLNLYKDEEFEG